MTNAIKRALDGGCSDIHITEGKPVAVRRNGVIATEPETISAGNITEFIKEIIPQKYDEFTNGNDVDASFELFGRRFRINVYNSASGISLAIRILNDIVPSIEDLSLPPCVNNFCEMETGLVLVVGTTGSGKTTTLASIINKINQTRAINILSIEEPIEYVYKEQLSRIVQREVGTHAGSFAEATRSAMRQDPDCILIGELRDLETISNAVTIAETGHLVFATLHSKSVTDTVDRMVDIFPAGQQEQVRLQLASVLRGVVYQKLVPNNSDGRTPLAQILTVDDTIYGMIRQKQNHNAIRDYMRCQKSAESVHIVDNAVWHIKNNLLNLDGIKNSVSIEDFNLINSLIKKRSDFY